MTKYLVFYRDGEGGWREAAEQVTASSATAAVRFVMAEKPDAFGGEGVQLVAVPSRSWRPRTVTIETKTRVALS